MSKYEPKSQGFLLIPSAILIHFLWTQSIAFHYRLTSVQKHAHRHCPARHLVRGWEIKFDDLIACSCRCHLFCFSNREKATGQIPALQTTLWEEEEEGGERGFWWSRAKGKFIDWGSAQWSCVRRWGVRSQFEVTTWISFIFTFLSGRHMKVLEQTHKCCQLWLHNLRRKGWGPAQIHLIKGCCCKEVIHLFV